MGFLTRCKRPFLFAFLLQFCNMLFSFFLKTFLILFEKQQKMSNNVAVDSSANSLITVHTDKAVAFVNPMTHVEAYRPEKGFSDAVKGFVLYQAKIVRPKELVVLNCKAGA